MTEQPDSNRQFLLSRLMAFHDHELGVEERRRFRDLLPANPDVVEALTALDRDAGYLRVGLAVLAEEAGQLDVWQAIKDQLPCQEKAAVADWLGAAWRYVLIPAASAAAATALVLWLWGSGTPARNQPPPELKVVQTLSRPAYRLLKHNEAEIEELDSERGDAMVFTTEKNGITVIWITNGVDQEQDSPKVRESGKPSAL